MRKMIVTSSLKLVRNVGNFESVAALESSEVEIEFVSAEDLEKKRLAVAKMVRDMALRSLNDGTQVFLADKTRKEVQKPRSNNSVSDDPCSL